MSELILFVVLVVFGCGTALAGLYVLLWAVLLILSPILARADRWDV